MSAQSPRVTLIDNYDSFTWNLVHYLGELGAQMTVWRNDRVSVDAVLTANPDAIVLSPGPCTPDEAGICLELIARANGRIPLLGVCLGHQSIGQAYGGQIIRAPIPVHGKLSTVRHAAKGLFRGINGTFQATRYHSLIVKRETMPDVLEITAETEEGLVMAIAHRHAPVHGVQFHPESILSEHGHRMLRNFLDLAQEWNEKSGRRQLSPTA